MLIIGPHHYSAHGRCSHHHLNWIGIFLSERVTTLSFDLLFHMSPLGTARARFTVLLIVTTGLVDHLMSVTIDAYKLGEQRCMNHDHGYSLTERDRIRPRGHPRAHPCIGKGALTCVSFLVAVIGFRFRKPGAFFSSTAAAAMISTAPHREIGNRARKHRSALDHPSDTGYRVHRTCLARQSGYKGRTQL